jgi:hypothetical protein
VNEFDKPPLNELVHYGVKGMKWGVRKERPDGVSARTNREARKDAEEYTRAKMFYGDGAGTRRKLINNTVAAKTARDPMYKKAFDFHVEKTDMSKRASQARGERKRKNVVSSTKKTTRGAVHILNGNNQYASAAAMVLVGGALYAHKAGIDKAIMKTAKTKVADLNNLATAKKNMKIAEDLLKNAGF